MKRLKTFLTYLLILLAFYCVSRFLEKGLIGNMYKDIIGQSNSILSYEGEEIDLGVNVTEAKATNANGYINVTITNYSNKTIEEAYLKIKLYTKSNVLSSTKYISIKNLKPGESRTYTLKFNGTYITRYEITCEKEFPDKDYIFNVFGYEINTKNIFGYDLSNVINAKSIGKFGRRSVNTFMVTAKAIPWWGWLGAAMIVMGVI